MSLQALKSFDVNRLLELDEAIYLYAEAEGLKAGYAAHELEVPEWLDQAIQSLQEEIAKRTQAALVAELKEAEADVERNRSAAERKAAASSRVDRLRKKLGYETAKAGK